MKERGRGLQLPLLGGTSSVDEPAPAPVHHLPPLRPIEPPQPVEVWERKDRDWWPGEATHWRGKRTFVRYRKGVGMQCLGWFAMDEVRRT